MFKDWRDASLLDWVIGAFVVAVIVFLFSGAARAEPLVCSEVITDSRYIGLSNLNSLFSGSPISYSAAYGGQSIVVCRAQRPFVVNRIVFTPYYGTSITTQSVTTVNCGFDYGTLTVCKDNGRSYYTSCVMGDIVYSKPSTYNGFTSSWPSIVSYSATMAKILSTIMQNSANASDVFYLYKNGFTGSTVLSFPSASYEIKPCLSYSPYCGSSGTPFVTGCGEFPSACSSGARCARSGRIFGSGLSVYDGGVTITNTGYVYSNGSSGPSPKLNSVSGYQDFFVMIVSTSSVSIGDTLPVLFGYSVDVSYNSSCTVDCSSVLDSGAPVCAAGALSAAGCSLVQPVSDATPFPEIIKGGAYTTSEALAYLRRVCVDVTVDACRAVLSKYHDYKYSVPEWFSGLDIYYQEKYK